MIIPTSKDQLFELIFGNEYTDKIEVLYEVNGKSIKEAEVVRCKNGAAVNYPEDYMRRRDPDCMRIGDELPRISRASATSTAMSSPTCARRPSAG